MIPARANAVTIGARDVRALRRFYESLGWTSRSPEGDEFAAFALGGAVLGIYDVELLAREANREAPPAGSWGGFSIGVNVERIEQVDEAIETARAAGAEILADPETRDWGGRPAYFAGPEGH